MSDREIFIEFYAQSTMGTLKRAKTNDEKIEALKSFGRICHEDGRRSLRKEFKKVLGFLEEDDIVERLQK